MKRILLRIAIGLIIVLIVAVLIVGLCLDGIVKKAVETVGPTLTKVDVKLDAVNLHLLAGSGKIKGLIIGNPPGYKTPQAIKVGTASLALQPSSLLGDKIIIKSISVESPEITFEGSLSGNNLKKIEANMDQPTTGGATNATPTAAKKLEVDDFSITGAKLDVTISGIMGSKSATLPLPPIHLTNLGTGPDGITAADLSKKVLTEVIHSAGQAVAEWLKTGGVAAVGLTKNVGTNAGSAVQSIGKGIGDLFKKK